MKKSKLIKLVLITSVLASCEKEVKQQDTQKVYMRSDTSATYSRSHIHGGGGANMWLWFYAFRPYGYYNNGAYHHSGFYSGGLSEHSNIGSNTVKSSVTRGGFGRSGFSVSS